MIRSVKSELEHKLNTQIDRRHPILALLPTHVADVMSRHRVGQLNRDALEELEGDLRVNFGRRCTFTRQCPRRQGMAWGGTSRSCRKAGIWDIMR